VWKLVTEGEIDTIMIVLSIFLPLCAWHVRKNILMKDQNAIDADQSAHIATESPGDDSGDHDVDTS